MDIQTTERVIKEIKKFLGKTKPVVGFRDPFKVLMSTLLSQRTKDEVTEKASKNLFSKFSSPEKLSQAKTSEIESLIKPVGFYRTKAKRVKEISKTLVERFGGKVPETLEELLSLPGVGRKTGNCVLVYGFGKPGIPVDTHVHRISNRLGWVKTKTPEETEVKLRELVPKKHWLELNELFVKFGQMVCKPINPRCRECVVRRLCEYGKRCLRSDN